jgi:hypothetical protein
VGTRHVYVEQLSTPTLAISSPGRYHAVRKMDSVLPPLYVGYSRQGPGSEMAVSLQFCGA